MHPSSLSEQLANAERRRAQLNQHEILRQSRQTRAQRNRNPSIPFKQPPTPIRVSLLRRTLMRTRRRTRPLDRQTLTQAPPTQSPLSTNENGISPLTGSIPVSRNNPTATDQPDGNGGLERKLTKKTMRGNWNYWALSRSISEDRMLRGALRRDVWARMSWTTKV